MPAFIVFEKVSSLEGFSRNLTILPSSVSTMPNCDGSSTFVRAIVTSAFLSLWKRRSSSILKSDSMSPPLPTMKVWSRNLDTSFTLPAVPAGSGSTEKRTDRSFCLYFSTPVIRLSNL